MPGFEHTANDTIEDLRRNLRDRYKDCHAVLKELLQNADDAGATELHIAWVEALQDVSHPLLKGPLLLIVNNGAFTYRDSYSIHLAGAGSKGDDEGKIGKFGLGLKSVFHLCEAYFYLSDPQGDEEQVLEQLKKYGRTGVLNPWSGARYTAWDKFDSNDQRQLRSLIDSLSQNPPDKWFSLCLPLRKQDHCREDSTDNPADWAIEPSYYGDFPDEPPTDVFSNSRIASIRHMLPLMSSLEVVRFSRITGASGSPPVTVAEVKRYAKNPVDWRTLTAGQASVSGMVDVDKQPHTYAGVQELLRNDKLSDLHAHSQWPRMDTQTKEGRKRKPAAAKQHAAAIIVDQPGRGALRVDRAVFLPLGDPPHSECQINGTHDFDLILHGYFFVDAGRRGVDFAPEGEQATIRQHWNSILYRDGTLGLIIPALREYSNVVAAQPDAAARLHQITSLLTHADCHLWRDHKPDICRDYFWCFRISHRTAKWCAVERNVPLVLLPDTEEVDQYLPFEVFPALRDLADSYALSFQGLPRLVVSTTTTWPDNFAATLLNSIELTDVSANANRLRYLGRVCTEACRQGGEAQLSLVVTLLRRMFVEVPMTVLRDHEPEVARLVSLLPPARIIPIPFNSNLITESERLFACLVKYDTQVLPVPALFVKDRHYSGTNLTVSDARILLVALTDLKPAGIQEDAFHSLVSQAVSTILAAWSPGHTNLLPEFGDLRIFYARNYSTRRRIALAANELKRSHTEQRLFATNASLCPKLQAVLGNTEVLFLLADKTLLPHLLTSLGTIPGCDAVACASLLLTRPNLKDVAEPRVGLLEEMLRTWSDHPTQEFRAALRYLLHRNSNDSHQISLFIDRQDAWSALTGTLLANVGETWRLVPKDMLRNVTAAQLDGLGIKQCDPWTVINLIGNADLSNVDCSAITSNDSYRVEIMRGWPEAEKEHLKSLPIFKRADGSFVSITKHTFIRGALPMPPSNVFPDMELVDDESGVMGERHLAPTLAPTDLVSTALEDDSCHLHWQFILESIPDDIDDSLRQKLRESRWLPDRDGNGHAPASVISLRDAGKYVTALQNAGRRIIHEDKLSPDLLAHARFQNVSRWFPRSKDLCKVLGDALRAMPHFAVGESAVTVDSLPVFVAMFNAEGGDTAMPTAHLLFLLEEAASCTKEQIAHHVLPAMRIHLDAERSIAVMAYLEQRHRKSAGADKAAIVDMFNHYLGDAAKHGLAPDILPQLQLLNQRDEWCTTSQLAFMGHNVSKDNLVAGHHASALRKKTREFQSGSDSNANSITDRKLDTIALKQSAKLLGDYLRSWRSDDVPDDAIAAVVSVLGDNDEYPKLYEDLRDTRALTSMRGLFSWYPTGPGGWGQRELMAKQHFCILPADADTVIATNVLGETFLAAVNTRVECLFDGFDGRSWISLPNDERCFLIRLRRIAPNQLCGDEKLAILSRSVLAIRSLIHRQSDEDFQSIWKQITHVGQLDIEIAQEMILESSAMLLETQLSVRASPHLKQLFNEWHQVRQRAKTATSDIDRRAAENDKQSVLESLRTMLRTDNQTQSLVVGEIRKRLEAVSYSASSIPFELFQNGDDAVVELESLCRTPDELDRARPPEFRRRFVVEVNSERTPILRFFHWGRGINQFRIGTADTKSNGFDRDMERMLVLQGSGKDNDDSDERRTGKFGLGFKSVFFVCDSPLVLSGVRSRFRVLAGVYPDQLSPAEEVRLQRALDREGDSSHRGTVVELPLRVANDADAALQRFRRLAGYLVVFARRIRDCRIGGSGEVSHEFEWNPESPIPGVEAGTIRVGASQSQKVLAFRLGEEGYRALLVPIVNNGISLVTSDDVPEVWVTTPTSEPRNGPLLVNGDFDLNPGRTQLRKTERNAVVAFDMGVELGRLLCSLHDLTAHNWPAIRDTLGCDDATAEDFWTSFWLACSRYASSQSGNNVVRTVLMGSEHCGMYRLIAETDALPSGLPDSYKCFTRLGALRWRIIGVLAEPEMWAIAASGEWVQKHVSPGTIVSPAIFEVLTKICPETKANTLSLLTIVEGAFHDGYIAETSIAHELGLLLPPGRLLSMRSNKRTEAEEQTIRNYLSRIKFRTLRGEWRDAARLLIGHGDEPERIEERRRASFAPSDKIVDPTYAGPALDFFLSCRGEMNAPAREMATWIVNANDPQTRKAALEYLEQGGQSYQVEQELKRVKASVANCWLDKMDDLVAAMPADANRQAVVMGKLQKGGDFAQLQFDTKVYLQPPVATRAPGAVFKDISKWWQKNHSEILSHHDQQIYPGAEPPKIHWTASQQQLTSDIEVRRGWLILFMRGSMYRIGRATQHQHRGFLDLCVERCWLDTLATNSDDPSSWFKIMEDYLESLESAAAYYQWMAQFLAYYQIARWLPRYARAFEAITRPGVNLGDLRSIRDISDLRTSHIFARSTGFDAPPCSRTLGIGSHFVLREAARLRAAETNGQPASPRLADLAYVPSRGTRRLVAQALGGGDELDKSAATQLLDDKVGRENASLIIAKMLHKHLKGEAHFDGAFDIPLLVLTWPKFITDYTRIFGQCVTAPEGEALDFLDDSGGGEGCSA